MLLTGVALFDRSFTAYVAALTYFSRDHLLGHACFQPEDGGTSHLCEDYYQGTGKPFPPFAWNLTIILSYVLLNVIRYSGLYHVNKTCDSVRSDQLAPG